MKNKFTIAFTRREAELYRSHGLLDEAQQLYREVLDESTTLGPSLKTSLQEKIGQLEIDSTELESEIDLSDVVSERELSILREGWGDAHSPSDISTCASALCNIRLYEAAIEECGKLIRLNQPHTDFIDVLTDCIVALYAPEKIGDAVQTIVARYQPPEAHPAGLQIGIAATLARRGLDQPALNLFQAAHSIRPLPDKAETFVKQIQKRLEHDANSTDNSTFTPTRKKGAARQIKIYLANCLVRLQGLLRR